MNRDDKRLFVTLTMVLSVLVVLLSGYLIYDKFVAKEEKNDVVNNESNEGDKVITSKEFISKFVGKYEYDGIEPGSSYHKLEIFSDGKYIYSTGMYNGGAYTANGNYSISENKIYLFNDRCNIANLDGECIYPNCQKIIELDYTYNDSGEITIKDGVIIPKVN